VNRSHAVALALLSFPLAACSGGGGTAATPTPAVTAATAGKASPTATAAQAAGGEPGVSSISFQPAQADGAPNVTDSIRASAVTSHPGVLVDWKWFINGKEVSGVLSDTLRPGGYKKGDKIEAQATPRDMKGAIGLPAKGTIMIRNSTPSITSRPTGSLNGYKAVVQDSDLGDPNERFTWTLEAPVPPGFSLSPDGTLKFDAAAGKAGAGQKVTIMVTDSAGALAKQTFDVSF
jgi:hypothetical protein